MDDIVVGRRMRVGRRRSRRGPALWIIMLMVVLVALAGGGYYWFHHAAGLDSIPDPPITAPGGYNATIGPGNTINAGLEVRNLANVPVTLLAARFVAPAGLTSIALAIVPTGEGNSGFDLEGKLPPSEPVELGTTASDRNAILAARFTVDCKGVLAAGADLDEQIFVTIRVAGEQKEVELAPPVIGDVTWLTATAKRICLDPVPTDPDTQPPLPPLPDSPGPSTTP